MFDPAVAQMLLSMSQAGGLSKFSTPQIFNFKLPTSQGMNGNLNTEEKQKLEGGINTFLNQGITTAQQLYANKEEAKTNPYSTSDIISKGALTQASQLPGIAGQIGSQLNFANTAFQQKIKVNDSGSRHLDTFSGLSGASMGAKSNANTISDFNNAGLLGQLFAKNRKQNSKKALKSDMNQWNQLGMQAKQMRSKNDKLMQNTLSIDSLNQNQNLIEGGFPKNIAFGRQGLEFMKKDKDTEFYKNRNRDNLLKKIDDLYQLNKELLSKIKEAKKSLTEKVQKKANGGSVNLIVDGQLHAHKHNLKDTKEFEDASITEKGVPVITMNAGGEIDQHQEVERDEIILNLELTKKLEELQKLGTDEAKIEAGRLLSVQILKNTKDPNKLLKTIQ